MGRGTRLAEKEIALRVTPGIDPPGSLDPEQARRFQHRRRRTRLTLGRYLEGIRRGDRIVLGQAITLIESDLDADQELAERLVEECLRERRESVRAGVTGVPGAGKSTFIDALGTYLTRVRGEKVAVLAVDPSSPLSGGSILGDKTRMARLSVDEKAYIRPTASRGSLGGVARKTRETIPLCEAAGFTNVLVETVGVGQSETAVASMVDFFLLLALAGAGDELQGIKRGIIELTDLIAINKADGDNRLPSELARRQYESALQLFPAPPSGWRTRVTTCSAALAENIEAIWSTVLDHQGFTRSNGWFEKRRGEQVRRSMFEAVEQALRAEFFRDPAIGEALPRLEQEVVAGRMSSYRAARRLLEIHRREPAAPPGTEKEKCPY